MWNPDNATLEWCAKWIEDALAAGETDERTVQFGRNMAMTFRALKTDVAASTEAQDERKLT